jgi:non-specific protein-tyrosine kinase
MHNIFRVPNMEGVTNLLRAPDLDVNDYLRDTGVENLKIITSGPLPPNSAEVIGSQRMADLVRRLKEVADVVLFDSSPVLAVTDAAVLSSRVDGVILVARAKRTRRNAARQAIRRLNQVGANIIGAVLNQASSKEGSYDHAADRAVKTASLVAANLCFLAGLLMCFVLTGGIWPVRAGVIKTSEVANVPLDETSEVYHYV